MKFRVAAVAMLGLLLFALPLSARQTVLQKKQKAQTYYANALKLREALTGKAEASRKRSDYTKVMDAFRRVYYLAPTSNKADESALAVAEVMAEYGRVFGEEKSFRNAIAQFEFLRREYPGSKFRVEALFTIGQIYREDLDDARQAQAAFADFLQRYPRHTLADKAKDALNDLESEAKLAKSGKKPAKKKSAAEPDAATQPVKAASPQETRRVERVIADETPAPEVRSGKLPLITSIRHWSTPDYTRIAIDLEAEVKYEAGRVPAPDRIFFDLHDTKLASELVGKSFEVGEGFLHKIRVAQFTTSLTRVVLEVDEVAEYSAFLLPNPYRLIIDIHGKQAPKSIIAKAVEPASQPSRNKPDEKATANKPVPTAPASDLAKNAAKARIDADEISDTKPDATKELTESAALNNKELNNKKVKATSEPTTLPTFETVSPRPERKEPKSAASKNIPKKNEDVARIREAKPTANGEHSLIRALGLKIGRIVVDAGHGGHDTGTIGPRGLQEKDLVLDVANRLGKMLETKLGAEVIYTRGDDTFIPLESRTAIANQHQADLFISVHANSSRDASARGVETYYLNFTSDSEALEVAARENAVSQKSVFELQDLVKKIALKDKIEESREFASNVQSALHAGLSTRNSSMRDRGVKKAPFVVLIGANMPSILAEISFVSNPSDEKRLKTPEHRQKIAESLFKGISRYASGLSGIKVASHLPEKTER